MKDKEFEQRLTVGLPASLREFVRATASDEDRSEGSVVRRALEAERQRKLRANEQDAA